MNRPVTVVGQMTSARADFMCQADGMTTFGNVRYRSEHRGPIPLLLEHDEGRRIGRVVFVQRSERSGLHAVAVLDPGVELADDVTWSMSAGLHGRSRRQHGDAIFEVRTYPDAELFEVSLTEFAPADTVAPVTIVRSVDIRFTRGGYPAGIPLVYRQALDRCHEQARAERRLPAHQRSDVLRIIDLDPLAAPAPPKPTVAEPPVLEPPIHGRAPTPVPVELLASATRPIHRRVNIGRVFGIA